jgi:nucleotide-binding universal stress UspA family protein
LNVSDDISCLSVAPSERTPGRIDNLWAVRILIATAGVLASEPVAEFVARLTDDGDAVYVATVIEVPRTFLDSIRTEQWHPLAEDAEAASTQEDRVIATYVEERGARITAPVLAALRNRDVNATTIFLEGVDPAVTIIQAAADLDAGLVVLGATKRLFDESHWESVSARVMRDAGRAVLIVPTPQRDDTDELDLPTAEIEIP